MKKQSYLGLKKILFPLQKARDFLNTSGPARVMYGSPPESMTGERGRNLVDFLKQVPLFGDLAQGDLRRVARIVHERAYRDGEIIFEQGTPGAALYLLRGGMVEIMRKTRNGEEIPLAMLEPSASFEELAAVGAEVVHWASARARGPGSRPGLPGGHWTFRPRCPQPQLPSPGEQDPYEARPGYCRSAPDAFGG